MIKLQELPSFSVINAGGTSILSLPIGPTYDVINIEISNGDPSDIETIKVLANGKVFQQPIMGGLGYKYLNTYYGRALPAFADNAMQLFFQRTEMTDVGIERLTSFGTADLSQATIEVKISAAADPTLKLKAYAVVSAPTPMGLITKIKTYPFNAGAGLNDVSTIVTGFINGQATPTSIAAIHFKKAVDDITALGVNINGSSMWDTVDIAQIELLTYLYHREPNMGVHVLDFILDGNHLSAMQCATVRDLRLKMECATAGMVEIMVEYFDGLNGVL